MAKRTKLQVLIIAFIIAIFVFPLFFLGLKSISYSWSWPDWRPTDFNLRAWIAVFHDSDIVSSIMITIYIGIAVVLLNFMIAFPTARAISRFQFRGKVMIETILFMPILIPVLAIAMGLHFTMIRLGLADQVLGVILIHLLPTLPYAIRILKAGFDRLNIAWEEQAMSLGGKPGVIFWRVTFPLLLPSVRSTAILVFVISLSQYVLTAIIGGGQVKTLPLIYYPFFNHADEAVMAAFSVLFTLLPIFFLLLLEIIIQSYLRIIRRP
ncbi:ABC transporter permease [Bacillus sp. Marseille-P3661]|uniref:ABC transporter permease n=1 Tax=Bacillus sp. Marseille-P3661 TaxID=1936234 RepID=UPI000C82D6BC|nr:ABC transporter permease subunit [Bacillus sp. Marseille-P3661]